MVSLGSTEQSWIKVQQAARKIQEDQLAKDRVNGREQSIKRIQLPARREGKL